MSHLWGWVCLAWIALSPFALAQDALPRTALEPKPISGVPSAQRISVPRLAGHLAAADLGVVINTADPYSVAVGEYYVQRRGIPEAQVLRVELPVRNSLNVAEFGALYAQIHQFMGPQVQALALAWTQPFAVACNHIT
jgi:hypothetical protein